jgi:hypothetical protein
MIKVLFYICLSIVALSLLVVVGNWSWVQWEYHLPSEQWVHDQFEGHKTDYIRFVTLLQKDPAATFIHSDGKVAIDGIHTRFVPDYRDLIRKIKVKDVIVREDGSIEFTLGGFGCVVCDDSYMGVRYVPNELKKVSNPGWTQTVVTSLDSTKLPQENGAVASGLYVIPIEPNWFVYRLEIQE